MSAARPGGAGTKSRWWDATLIFEIALVVRLLYFVELRRSPFFDFLHLDPLYYHDWALRIASGDWIGREVFEQSPLYPYLLAVYFLIFGHDLTLLRLLQFGAGSLTAALVGVLARRLFGRSAGLVAGIGAALYAPFLFYEGQVMKEFLTPLFTTTLLLLLIPGEETAPSRGRLRAGLAGAVLGLTALVRDNALLLLPVLALYLLFQKRRQGGAREAACLGLGAFLVLLPVTLRNAAVSGEIVLTTSGGGEVFYIGNGPQANGAYAPPPWVRPDPRYEHEDFRRRAREMAGRDLTRAEASSFWYAEGMRTILEHPGRFPLLLARKALLFLNDHELADNYAFDSFRSFSWVLTCLPTFGWVAALAAAGLIASRSRRREMAPLYLVGAGYMASVIVFFNFARFRLPFLPVLLVFAGHGAVVLGRQAASLATAKAEERRRFAGHLLAAVAVLAGTHASLTSLTGEEFQGRLNLAAAYRQQGRIGESVEILEAAIRRGEAILALSDRDPGSPSRPEAAVVSRSVHTAHRALAEIELSRSRSGPAIAELRAAASLDPTDAAVLEMLGDACRSLGDLKGAASAYAQGLAASPRSYSLRFALAGTLYQQGDPSRALAELEEARRVDPEPDPRRLADWSYAMGFVLESLPSRRHEAGAYLRKGLELSPAHAQSDHARASLTSLPE